MKHGKQEVEGQALQTRVVQSYKSVRAETASVVISSVSFLAVRHF
jgi:hypothetical protein